MNRTLSVALIGDGTSDAALWPVIVWSLIDRFAERLNVRQAGFQHRGGVDPEVCLRDVQERFAPDLVIFHRDAEGEPLAIRRAEIPVASGLVVPVIPVRMTEAWLLIEPAAIAKAADNPGARSLKVPAARELEVMKDPKGHLEELLLAAADLTGARHKARFTRDLASRKRAVADYITTYKPLRQLSAFQQFEQDLYEWVNTWLDAPSMTADIRRDVPKAASRRKTK